MQLIKVGAAVLNQTPLAWAANKANILEAIRQAKADDVSILCLPEMCITGYGCEDQERVGGGNDVGAGNLGRRSGLAKCGLSVLVPCQGGDDLMLGHRFARVL